MTTAIAEKNILVKDLDGNWYAIPPHLKSAFEYMKETIMNAVQHSDEWFDAQSNFNDAFGEYAKDD